MLCMSEICGSTSNLLVYGYWQDFMNSMPQSSLFALHCKFLDIQEKATGLGSLQSQQLQD